LSLRITALTAVNVGDGKRVELSWSVIDPRTAGFYQVERYDNSKRQWVPYDGFRGIVAPAPSDPDRLAPRRVMVVVPKPGEHSFRVRSIAQETMAKSEWSTTSVEVSVTAGYLSDNGASYIVNAAGSSLRVERVNSRLLVQAGAAFIDGVRRTLVAPVSLPLPAQDFLVILNAEGLVQIVEAASTPAGALRLADGCYHEGELILRDTRRLWAPTELQAVGGGEETPSVAVSWEGYDEKNLSGWMLYRGLDEERLEPIGRVEKDIVLYTDTRGVNYGSRYIYAVAAVDPIGQESPKAFVQSSLVGDGLPPAKPLNLSFSWSGSYGNLRVDLSWDRNEEEDMASYEVYAQSGEHWLWAGHVPQPPAGARPIFTLFDFAVDETRVYRVVAVDRQNNASEPSDSLSITAGDTTIPLPPDWETPALSTTGSGSQSSITLTWRPVLFNTNGSICNDLKRYILYISSDGLDYQEYGSVEPDQNETLLEHFTAGTEVWFKVQAEDLWYHRSAISDARSIVAGDLTIPTAPTNLTAQPDTKGGVHMITLAWNPTTTNTNGTAITDLEGYILRRDGHEIVQLADTEYVDSGLMLGREYAYAVCAIDRHGNRSGWTTVSEEAGDLTPPSAPTPTSPVVGYNAVDGLHVTLAWSIVKPADFAAVRIYIQGYPGFISVPMANSYKHSHLQQGQTYTYSFTSVDVHGNESTAISQSVEVRNNVKPATPTGLSGSGAYVDGSARILLSWNAVTQSSTAQALGTGANPPLGGYLIYRSLSASGPFDLIADQAETSYVDQGLLNGKIVFYQVKAYTILREVGEAASTSAVAGDVAPPQTPSVTVSQSRATNPLDCDLTFSVIRTGTEVPHHFELHVADNIGSTYLPYATSEATPNQLSASFAHQIPYRTTYRYRIYAVDAVGNKSDPWSDVITPEPAEVAMPSIVPSWQLSKLNAADQLYQIELEWSDFVVPDTWAAYVVYFDETAYQTVARITDLAQKNWKDFGLSEGETYQYAVTWIDVYGRESEPEWITILPSDTTTPNAPVLSAETFPTAILPQWTQPTNSDDSPFDDLDAYLLEADLGPSFGGSSKRSWRTRELSILHHVSFVDDWYYRVRAFDRSGKASPWSQTVGPISSKGIDGTELSLDLASAPTISLGSGGVELSNEGSRAAYQNITWNANDLDATDYIIYLDANSVAVVPRGDRSTLSYRLSGLMPGAQHQATVTARNALGFESSASNTLTFTAATITDAPPAPRNLNAILGPSLLALTWLHAPHPQNNSRLYPLLDHYELQYRMTTQMPGTPNRVWTEWYTVTSGKDTSFVHTRLDHTSYYQYRVRALDTSGNVSTWVYGSGSVNHEYSPSQAGSSDIAYGAVIAGHVQAGSISGSHIQADSISGGHLQSQTIVSRHIQANQIDASHLNITVGGRNYVKNSAFGMRDLNGNLGVDWSGGNFVSGSDIPAGGWALYLTGSNSITQTIDVTGLAGKSVVLSAYVRARNLTGTTYIELLHPSNEVVYASISVSSTDWTRQADPMSVSSLEDRILLPQISSARIRIRYPGGVSGELWVTGIKLEEGDFPTPWQPKDGEAYGASGRVQINSTGLYVTDGQIRITTGSGNSVHLDGAGITSGSYSGATLVSGARLDADGLSILGGGFYLDDENATFAMYGRAKGATPPGIHVWKDGVKTVEILASGEVTLRKSFTLDTSTSGSGGRVVLNQTGMSVYKGAEATPSVQIDVTSGKLMRLRNGEFEIMSGSTLGSANSLSLTATEFRLNGSSGAIFRATTQAGEKSVSIVGDFEIKSSASPSARLEMQSDALRIYPANQIDPAILLGLVQSEPRLVLNGDQGASFVVKTTDQGIVFTEEGLTVSKDGTPVATLSGDGFTLGAGNVTIRDTGVLIDGSAGIVVKNGATELVSINNSGIQLKAQSSLTITGSGGLSMTGSGSIRFASGDTWITSTGIHCAALKTGQLVVKDNQATIRVEDAGGNVKAQIDSSGINIYGGALNVYGNDSVLIQNGQVVATALNIRTAGSNLLRNGRGDFGTAEWTGTASASVVEASLAPNITQAPISGDQVFRISGSSGQAWGQTVGGYFSLNSSFILCGWIYQQSGSMGQATLEIQGMKASLAASSPVTYQPPDLTAWRRFEIPMLSTGVQPVVRLRLTGSATVYLTDLCLVRGEFGVDFTPHAEELINADGSVRIDREGIFVTNGRISIASTSGAIAFDAQGLRHRIQRLGLWEDGIFKLDDTGLDIDFSKAEVGATRLRIGKPQGGEYGIYLTKRNLDDTADLGRVELTPQGLLIEDNDGSGDVIRITSNVGGVSSVLSAKQIAFTYGTNELSLSATQGLKVVGPGMIDIRGSAGANTDYVRIQDNVLQVYQQNPHGAQAQLIAELGKWSQGGNVGLRLEGGAFRINGTGDDGESLEITERSIVFNHTDRTFTDAEGVDITAPMKTIIDKNGLRLVSPDGAQNYGTGVFQIETGFGMANGEFIAFRKDWPAPPHIMIIPKNFKTYNAGAATSSQSIAYDAESFINGFRPTCALTTHESTALDWDTVYVSTPVLYPYLWDEGIVGNLLPDDRYGPGLARALEIRTVDHATAFDLELHMHVGTTDYELGHYAHVQVQFAAEDAQGNVGTWENLADAQVTWEWPGPYERVISIRRVNLPASHYRIRFLTDIAYDGMNYDYDSSSGHAGGLTSDGCFIQIERASYTKAMSLSLPEDMEITWIAIL
jgi:fibronectin type 3 domain-containing protein